MATDINFLFQIPEYSFKNHPKSDLLAHKVNGAWKKYSSKDFCEITDQVASGFHALGLKAGDRIAMASFNCPQWQFINLGAAKLGVVNAPLYANITAEEYKFILNDCKARVMMVENQELFDKIHSIKDEVESLEHIFSFDEIDGCKHWTEIQNLGKENPVPEVLKENQSKADPNKLYTLIYTSGTTGNPKGVMLSHKNILSQIDAVQKILPIGESDTGLSFLPLCHSFERTIEYFYMYLGTSIYYAESMDTIGDNLKEVKPTIMPTVPRLLEKVYDKIMAKGADLTGIKKALFFWAVDLGLEYEYSGKSAWYSFKLKIANKIIFSKWREALGGNMRMIASGAAALQPRLARLFTAAGIPILEGYGLSETSPVISVNQFNVQGRKFGTVGPVIENVEVKIADDGEILCKGPNVMLGYLNRPDLTKEVIDDDGWFHTGDIGKIEDGRFIKITDRKKEIFKTSGGKYVAPQVLENKYKESSLIDQIMVIGEGEKHPAALISPNFEALEEYCNHKGIPFNNQEEVVKNPEIIDKFEREINKQNHHFSKYEQVKKIAVLPATWSVETGELTPTLKLKRRVIMQKFESQVKAIYQG